ncbi:Uncharacterised protein [uncultured archaeon]|nr:Uncharacterised protein [uncultured archaeon]
MGFWDIFFGSSPKAQQSQSQPCRPSQAAPLIQDTNRILTQQEALLRRLNEGLVNSPQHGDITSEYTTRNNYSAFRIGKSWFFNQNITFAGTVMDIQLTNINAMVYNKISLSFDDATAKDFDIRGYPEASSSAYEDLDNKTADTNQFVLVATDYKMPPSSVLLIHFANFTVGKKCSIRIQGDEI